MNQITLGEYLEALRHANKEEDIEVDGINSIAYCGTDLTDEGRKRFGSCLDLPMLTEKGRVVPVVIGQTDEDYAGNGRLELAWEMLKSMAGYCLCSNYDRWFIDDDF